MIRLRRISKTRGLSHVDLLIKKSIKEKNSEYQADECAIIEKEPYTATT
jgi:hypothetical protein